MTVQTAIIMNIQSTLDDMGIGLSILFWVVLFAWIYLNKPNNNK